MLFLPICSDQGIKRLASIADEIWHEYWPAIIGDQQTDYMVDQFQSVKALTNDIKRNHYLYWFLEDGGKIVGYMGARPEVNKGKLFISKIYLFEAARGKGYASKSIAFFESFCKVNGLTSMYLTVSKENSLAIRAYEGKGFRSIDSVETDIGSGFVMDDYVMEKEVH